MLVKISYDRAKPKGLLRDTLAAAYEPKPMVTSPGVKPDSSLGDFDGAFAQAPVKIDVEYTTPSQIHAQMEPHATIAEWQTGPDGDAVVLYSANQMPNRGQPPLGSVLKLPPRRSASSHRISAAVSARSSRPCRRRRSRRWPPRW